MNVENSQETNASDGAGERQREREWDEAKNIDKIRERIEHLFCAVFLVVCIWCIDKSRARWLFWCDTILYAQYNERAQDLNNAWAARSALMKKEQTIHETFIWVQ